MGVVSSIATTVVTSTAGAAVVAAAVVVSGTGGWVDVMTGGGVELHEGTAHGQLQTLTLTQ